MSLWGPRDASGVNVRAEGRLPGPWRYFQDVPAQTDPIPGRNRQAGTEALAYPSFTGGTNSSLLVRGSVDVCLVGIGHGSEEPKLIPVVVFTCRYVGVCCTRPEVRV